MISSFERKVNILGKMDHLDISKLDSIIEILIKKVIRNVCLRGDSQSVTQLTSLFLLLLSLSFILILMN